MMTLTVAAELLDELDDIELLDSELLKSELLEEELDELLLDRAELLLPPLPPPQALSISTSKLTTILK